MKKLFLIVMILSVNAFGIVGELWKHCNDANSVYFIYQPTGAGDWYRWRVMERGFVTNGQDLTYPALNGAIRGKVYAGTQYNYSESTANSGYTITATVHGCTISRSITYSQYRTFTNPAGSTNFRAWFWGISGKGLARITFQNSGGTEISHNDFSLNTTVSAIINSGWIDIPAGTVTVKIHKAVDNTDYVEFLGVDFINTNSIVEPTTAGSMMFDDDSGDTESVLAGGATWGTGLSLAVSTYEFAINWSDDGGAFSSNNLVGGISHAGVDSASGSGTAVWSTQSGTGDLTTWSPDAGEKTDAVDYVVLTLTDMAVYKESLRSNRRGTLAGTLQFNASGVMVDNTITVDSGQNMDVFQTYLLQCRFPADVKKCMFFGENAQRTIGATNLISSVKSDGMRIWGGAAHTEYELLSISAADMNYLKQVSTPATFYPNIVVTSGYPKAYIHQCDISTTTKQIDLGEGESFKTKFKIFIHEELPQTTAWNF